MCSLKLLVDMVLGHWVESHLVVLTVSFEPQNIWFAASAAFDMMSAATPVESPKGGPLEHS